MTTSQINGSSPNIFVPPVLSDAEREVMERLPMKQAMRDLTRQLDAELNAALQAAIEAHLGEPLTDPEILRGRLAHVDKQGEPQLGRTYLMDGKPILWVGPVAITREGDTLTAKRDMRQLVEEVPDA